MRIDGSRVSMFAIGLLSFSLYSCSSYLTDDSSLPDSTPTTSTKALGGYAGRLPAHIDTGGGRVVLVNPNVHAWGAYGPDGNLVRAGLASAGANWCEDTGRECQTSIGTFTVRSLGSAGCKSPSFPLPHGGAPMPYCMYFTRSQALHGSSHVTEGNISHGCVRMRVSDAKWLRYNFVTVGTKVIIEPY